MNNRIDELNAKMDKCGHGVPAQKCWMCQEKDYDRRHRVLLSGAIGFAIFSFLVFAFTKLSRGDEFLPTALANPPVKKSSGKGDEAVEVPHAYPERNSANRSAITGLAAARPLGAQTADLGRGAELISERFLDALALVESGNNPRAVGKRGERGAYQMSRAARAQVNKILKASGTFFFVGASKDYRDRCVAREYCLWTEAQLTRALCRPPTAGEVYAAYNLGPNGFKRCRYELPRCPKSTQRNAKIIEGITK